MFLVPHLAGTENKTPVRLRADERSNSVDNDVDRSNDRAPNDPRAYERDRYGDYPPQRY